MNKNQKIINMKTDKMFEDMTPQEQQEFFNQKPTRQEVSDFVGGYISNEVIPIILNSVGKELFQLRCRNEVLLKILIDSGVTTAEGFEELYKQHLKQEQEAAAKRQQELQKRMESPIIVPDKTILH